MKKQLLLIGLLNIIFVGLNGAEELHHKAVPIQAPPTNILTHIHKKGMRSTLGHVTRKHKYDVSNLHDFRYIPVSFFDPAHLPPRSIYVTAGNKLFIYKKIDEKRAYPWSLNFVQSLNSDGFMVKPLENEKNRLTDFEDHYEILLTAPQDIVFTNTQGTEVTVTVQVEPLLYTAEPPTSKAMPAPTPPKTSKPLHNRLRPA
ncbi:hypothetical protein K9K77_01075 [Candidatus Babeliales bacterium]|nr:hypothetical protein [Candidatus Babeliales bacterium]